MPKTDDNFDLRDYATVAERVALFYSAYPGGRIQTCLVRRNDTETIFKALVFRNADDPRPAATGWAAEKEGDGDINTYACVENTETSAAGRALANLGFTASSKRASREEMEKVTRAKRSAAERRMPSPSPMSTHRQDLANALHDLFDLLADARGEGFPARRAEIIRDHFGKNANCSLPRVRRIEDKVRVWLKHQDV